MFKKIITYLVMASFVFSSTIVPSISYGSDTQSNAAEVEVFKQVRIIGNQKLTATQLQNKLRLVSNQYMEQLKAHNVEMSSQRFLDAALETKIIDPVRAEAINSKLASVTGTSQTEVERSKLIILSTELARAKHTGSGYNGTEVAETASEGYGWIGVFVLMAIVLLCANGEICA